jgi:uncharacterized protein (TIGR03085 family)
LSTLLDQTGPDAPTLCAGWQTSDLAAHLVLREHRPDAAVGILGGPLASYTERIQHNLSARTPFPMLVELIRTGPPRLSLFGLPGVDAKANFAEYFVHHEDVRRAQPRWEPRRLDDSLNNAIWDQLRQARLMLRKVPVGIEFARDDVAQRSGTQRSADQTAGEPRAVRMTLRARTPMVTVIGPPAELLMWAFGRTSGALVQLEGAEADVAALKQSNWGI